MTKISQVAGRDELDEVRRLMRAFVAWHRELHREDHDLINAYFDEEAFERELASLPGEYAPPTGALLLAAHGGRPAGCVALRRIDEDACEMKRMFVDTSFQGKGIGRALGEAVIREARALGYRAMLLDTSFRQVGALRLYESLGFRRIEPYYEIPDRLREWLVFMRMAL